LAKLSTGTIVRIYAQGADTILRLITKLEDRIEDLEAQLTRSPQPVTASLMNEVAKANSTLTRQVDDLIVERQLNYQLRRRIRELEHEIESGGSNGAAGVRPSSICKLCGMYFLELIKRCGFGFLVSRPSKNLRIMYFSLC
jgi:hypothetical protein